MENPHVFVIRNQFGQYLDKHQGWQSGKDANALYRAIHHDEALNTLFEVNSRDIDLRGVILKVGIDDKKRPLVDVSEQALAMDKPDAQQDPGPDSHPEEEANHAESRFS